MGLITRTLPPDDKGFKLTFQEMDNNLYYLQGLGISGFSFSSNTITISNPTGGTKSVLINNLTGLTINGNLFVTGQTKSSTISATTISATTIDLCGSNGTLYTDSISGCSPINVLSETIFNNGLSGTTISGETIYLSGTNITSLLGGSGDYLPLSGGTVTGDTYFTQSVTASTFNGLSLGLGGYNYTTNVSVGVGSLIFNNSGNFNTSLGAYSLRSNTGGNSNTSIGYRSMFGNITGNKNVSIGHYSMHSNTYGSMNVGIGYQSLYSNTTGQYNVALGLSALMNNTTGSFNTALGYNVQSNNFSGSTILGAGAAATGDNQLVIGSTAYPLGPVTVETSGSTKTLTVIINGVQEKILLA